MRWSSAGWIHEASGVFVCYLVVQFVGSAVQPQSTASQSGPARNVSEMRTSGPGTPSHCCPPQDWTGTTGNGNGDKQVSVSNDIHEDFSFPIDQRLDLKEQNHPCVPS